MAYYYKNSVAIETESKKGIFLKIERIAEKKYREVKVTVGYEIVSIDIFLTTEIILLDDYVGANRNEFTDKIEEALEIIKTEY